MKIHFIVPPLFKKSNESDIGKIYPPLGVLYISAFIKKTFQDLEIKVTNGYNIGVKKTLKEIEKFDADLLGFSFSSQLAQSAYKLINKVKKDKMVVCGGPHPSIMPEEVLEESAADIVVIGEGEITFKEILEYYHEKKELGEIKGIAYKRKRKIVKTQLRPMVKDVDSIPMPDRGLINMNEYSGYVMSKNKKDMHFISSRGCPFNCVFCSNPVWRRTCRLRNPKKVVDEIEVLKEMGATELFDESDTFNLSRDWVLRFCDEMIKRKINIPWKAQVRVKNVDDELARKMAEAGCHLVFLGVESANNHVLKGVRKNIRKNDILKACRAFSKHGIKVFGLIMIFNVWEEDGRLRYETIDDCMNTLEFTRYLVLSGLLYNTTWCVATPIPGNDLYAIAKKYKILKDDFELIDWGFVWKSPLRLPGITDEDVSIVKSKGALLQAYCILRNREITFKNLHFIYAKGFHLIRNYARSAFKKAFSAKK
jgi:radical SAM superfamily enzyme YgiQ (UPF0313 family)